MSQVNQRILLLLGSLLFAAFAAFAATAEDPGDLAAVKTLSVDRSLTAGGRSCITCHASIDPGVVGDWKNSRHGHVGVSCIDCHAVSKGSPMAVSHEDSFDLSGHDASLLDPGVAVSVLVPPSTCARCHAEEYGQFAASGHYRSYHQIIPKDNLHALTEIHEGRNHPQLKGAPVETGCMQCHGTKIVLDDDNRPTPETWPNAGMGNIYPDGSTGNCSACHTRHRFAISEARKPHACASCHLGPDHPNIEIFEASKHGHIYLTQGNEWDWDTAPGAWEPGDYRGPVCATCHMSGIGELTTTHNVSDRLYWVSWAERSMVRNAADPMSPRLGNGPKGRERMKTVCASCHGSLHTESFFTQADKAVQLYNVAYFDPATEMKDELQEKGLLGDNPWNDEFQITYYMLWHHQGRRARMGALHGAADYAHWHGFFELQQDLYKLESIYRERLERGSID